MKATLTPILTTFIFLLFLLHTTTAGRGTCYNQLEKVYQNCPDCGAYAAEGVTPLKNGEILPLHMCKDKPLNLAECARLCICAKGGTELWCQGFNGCSKRTVTNQCKCIWRGSDEEGGCINDSLNKKSQHGGVCFCPPKGSCGSPPHPCED